MNVKLIYGRDQLWLQFPENASVNVAEVFEFLKKSHPGAYQALCEKNGRLPGSLIVFVNHENIRYRDRMETELDDGDEVLVIPIVAGG